MATSEMFCENCQKSTHLQHEGTTDHCSMKLMSDHVALSLGFSSGASPPYSTPFTNELNDSPKSTPKSCNGMYCCEICNIKVSGIIPFIDHVTGAKHKKKLEAMKILTPPEPNRDDCFKKIEEIQKPAELEIDVEKSPVKPEQVDSTKLMFPFFCGPCGKKFTGEKLYHQHMGRPIHEKKIKNLGMHGNLFSNRSPADLQQASVSIDPPKNFDTRSPIFLNSPPNPANSRNLLLPFACEACSKQFSRIEPYQLHLQSVEHKNKIKLILGSLLPDIITCDVCQGQLSFSGPIPFKQHIESVKHAKKVKINDLLKAQSIPMAVAPEAPAIIEEKEKIQIENASIPEVATPEAFAIIEEKRKNLDLALSNALKLMNEYEGKQEQLVPLMEAINLAISSMLTPVNVYEGKQEQPAALMEEIKSLGLATSNVLKLRKVYEGKREELAALMEEIKSLGLATSNVLKLMNAYN